MSKSSKRRAARKRSQKQADEIIAIFTAQTEPITDENIDEIIEVLGMPRDQVLEAKEAGLQYCRERKSFMSAPELGGVSIR